MRRNATIVGLIALFTLACAVPAAAQDSPKKLAFENYGFELLPLEVESDQQTVALQMGMPAHDSFAANINVLIQPYAGSMADYVAETETGMKQTGLQLTSTVELDGYLTIEYSGAIAGKNLHFYAKAFKRGDKFYLVTATALESGWPTEKEQLMRVVDSFKNTK